MAGAQRDSEMLTPCLGRGRGVLRDSVFVAGKPRVLNYSPELPSPFIDHPVGPTASTPSNDDGNVTRQLRDLICELGSQIGDSIASRLLASNNANISTIPPPASSARPGHSNAGLSLSNVNLVVKSDVKEPPMFRGDGTDRYNVQEWIEIMDLYLRKKDCLETDQADEILSHLLGRAKSIVKVRLKSSPSAHVSSETIYDVLKRYFSDSPASCQPLADFYATCPKVNECPVDFWV